MAATRLPGIYFQSVTVPPPALLPRMDIPGFAGFLPSGPVGVPFALEDPDRFQEIFGTDLALAWDREQNEMRLAQTPPAVRAFFREGGQRCWVLRLANGAQSNAWTVPGLLLVDETDRFHAGWVLARSEGSWSDELTVNAALLESPLPAQPKWPTTGTLPPQPMALELNPGDVAQLFFPDQQTLAFYDYSSSRWFWFAPALTSPPLREPDRVSFLGAGTDTSVAFQSFWIRNGELILGVSRDVAATIPAGSWLQLAFAGRTMLAQVEGITAGPSLSGSPPGNADAILTSTLAWWSLDLDAAWSANQGQKFQASVVTFELRAWPSGAPAQRIVDLGFSAASPRYWGLLPTDAVLYAPVTRPSPSPYAALAAAIDNPRFPLAGPTSTELGFPPLGLPPLGLPLGMTALVRDSFTQGATRPGATALDRDGLTSFDQTLFIDPNLQGLKSTALLTTAFYLQYQASDARSLKGVHGLLGTDEISLIVAPDAIHSGWQRDPVQTPTLGSPDHVSVSTPDEAGNYTVSWTSVTGAAGYTLDESSDPLFPATAVTSRDAGATVSMALSNNAHCPLTLYYRVTAYGSSGNGPWSETASVELGTGDFTPCMVQLLAAPRLRLLAESDQVALEWEPPPEPVDGYTLQTAGDPLFVSGSQLYQGTATGFQYWTTPGPPSYFRVNAQRSGQASPWSNTVYSTPAPSTPWVVSQSEPTVFMPVHQALLAMAAARADLVAILSLPFSYRKADAVAYQAKLAAFAIDSVPTASYGALYHPWIVVSETASTPPLSLRTLVPDGAVCGLIAATTLSSGAWIAPANIAVANAVALAPTLESDTAVAFAASQINLVARHPAGFMITSQDTLMPDGADLQPLNVRRLLILLRRLALREGTRYVFQNNSPTFQRAVTRQFQQWMQLMLARGAFAGATAQDSYQVIADASLNTRGSIDQGRFVVDLLVAPSLPMRFLTVRLMQSDGQLSVMEI
jgi:hypothetical protein